MESGMDQISDRSLQDVVLCSNRSEDVVAVVGLEWEGSGRKTGDFGRWGSYLKRSATSTCQGKMAADREAHIHCYNSLGLRDVCPSPCAWRAALLVAGNMNSPAPRDTVKSPCRAESLAIFAQSSIHLSIVCDRPESLYPHSLILGTRMCAIAESLPLFKPICQVTRRLMNASAFDSLLISTKSHRP